MLNKSFWKTYSKWYDSIASLIPYQEMMEDLEKELLIEPGLKILNVGAGTGNFEAFVVSKYPQTEFTAIDSSEDMLELAKGKVREFTNVRIKLCNVEDFLEQCGEFDRIMSSNVLYTLKEPVRIVEKMKHKLKHGGIMAHTTPHNRWNPLNHFKYHCCKSKGFKAHIKTVAYVPALVMVGLMNIPIMNDGNKRQKFWTPDDLKQIFSSTGMTVKKLYNTYGDQDCIIVCRKEK